MITFAHPYLLLFLLALPVLAWLKQRYSRESAFIYSSTQLLKRFANLKRSPYTAILRFMRWLAIALFIVALAQPRLPYGRTADSASGIDIIVALDLSSSMASEDFELRGNRVNRLAIAKHVLRRFIRQRPHDRIGLVAFAAQPYVAAPLTLDHDFLLTNLQRLELGRISDGTAIGAALSTTLNRLRDIESKSKIVILMTDGQETVREIPPLTAAEAAQSLGIKVYTIGVGTHGTAPIPTTRMPGSQGYQRIKVNIDEEMLRKIAQMTGGKYYRADDTDRLRTIYEEIDRLEKSKVQVTPYTRYQELFYIPLAIGLALIGLEIMLTHTRWRKLP